MVTKKKAKKKVQKKTKQKKTKSTKKKGKKTTKKGVKGAKNKNSYPEGALLFGRPTVFKPEYCQLLMKHMAEGGSFESFAAVVNYARSTIYYWLEIHPNFLDAKRIGETKALKFFEDVGKAGMTGTLRRVVSEKVKMNAGEIVYKDGNPIIDKKYAPARFDNKVWSINMKNRFGFVEKIQISGNLGHTIRNISDMTDAEIERELKELEDQE